MWRVGVGARACNNICCCIMFAQQTFPNQMSHMGSSAKNREAGRGVCVEVVYLYLCFTSKPHKNKIVHRCPTGRYQISISSPTAVWGSSYFNVWPDGNSFSSP